MFESSLFIVDSLKRFSLNILHSQLMHSHRMQCAVCTHGLDSLSLSLVWLLNVFVYSETKWMKENMLEHTSAEGALISWIPSKFEWNRSVQIEKSKSVLSMEDAPYRISCSKNVNKLAQWRSFFKIITHRMDDCVERMFLFHHSQSNYIFQTFQTAH